MELTSNGGLNRASDATVKRVRTLWIGACFGLFACFLAPAGGSAQPEEFCLGGVIWRSVDVPPALARKLTISESFALGSQILFGSPRLRDELVVSVHGAGTCQACHQRRGLAGRGTGDEIWADRELVVIRQSPRDRWFWGADYEAILVRATTSGCEVETAGVLGGAPSVDGLLGHQESGSDTRFIIESELMVRELDPNTASVLVTPARGSARSR